MVRRSGYAALLILTCCFTLVFGLSGVGASNQSAALQASPEASPCADVTDEEATTLVTAFLDAFVTGDVSVYDEILASDYVHHWGVGDDAVGIEEHKERVAEFTAAFDTWEWGDFTVIVAEDYVIVIWSVTSRQVEPWFGIAPSGVETVHTGINIFRIECGLIAESWNESDHLNRLIQAGMISEDALGGVSTPVP